MLDSLYQKNPSAYRTVIKEQMELGKAATAPPEPYLLIRTKINDKKHKFIYILFCSWSRITQSQDKDEKINVIGGEPFKVMDCLGKKDTEVMMYPLAFNNEMLKEMLGKDSKEMNQLEFIDMALTFIKMQKHVNIDMDSTYEICNEKMIGSLDKMYNSFQYKPFDPETEFKECFGDLTKTTDLLQEISQIKGNNKDDEELSDLKFSKSSEFQNNKQPKIFIEELNEPVINCNKNTRQITIEIPVPNIKSIMDLELDVSENALHLEIPKDKSFKALNIEFPCAVLVDSCEAKFRKKLKKLFIVLSMK